MKQYNHFVFAISMFVLLGAALVSYAVFGYFVERDIVAVAADQPTIRIPEDRGARVAGVSIDAIESATIIIDNQAGDPLEVDIPAVPGMTVDEALTHVTRAFDLAYETVDSPVGAVIRQIGDRTNGDDNAYWSYSVNQRTPYLPIDQYVVEGGDEIVLTFTQASPY